MAATTAQTGETLTRQTSQSNTSYSGGPGFKSQPGDQLFWGLVFFSLRRQIPWQHLKLGNDRFLSHPFQFIIH
jgi:hypothetical protein